MSTLNAVPTLEAVATPDAPAAIGPYSQAIVAGDTIYVSGQLPIDPATGELVEATIASQVTQSLRNLGAILHAAGSSMERVVKTTVFLADLAHFAEANVHYEAAFPSQPRPARSAFQVVALPRGALVEIEAIATR